MIDHRDLEAWFVTGSQHLYGPEALDRVARDSREIVDWLNREADLPVELAFRPVLTTSDEIAALLAEANADPRCVGIVAWMHTFSPAKMWIGGLERLRRPLCHLHTQFNAEIPWATIDMDFMNLNQSAHGDREFGFVCSRLGLERKVVVGHWKESAVHARLGAWLRAAAAWHDSQRMRIARIGDNMRRVAVTEGDKVEAERRFGYAVDGFGVGDLVEHVEAAAEDAVDALCDEYASAYALAEGLEEGGPRHPSLRDAVVREDHGAHVPTRRTSGARPGRGTGPRRARWPRGSGGPGASRSSWHRRSAGSRRPSSPTAGRWPWGSRATWSPPTSRPASS